MAKSKLSEQEQVTEYIQKLDPSISETITFLRQVILAINNEISEHIKWNSPSFYYWGEMKPFDPKEYKRDILVMNIRPGKSILLVFPTGIKITDTSGLLEGNYSDGRKIATIKNLEEAKSRQKDLENAIRNWMDQIEK
ncbi:MAG: DUF1801 domain-containing protein [Flavobacterium lindanitolerans]|uniref:DUF1801 domain-containing protein n=1 Tax=Flavobacterium lindanitolerans TaxID=428988 RepID=UPI001A614F4E|nr:DUF1801 domain-containing protein [Flavobacterium lindanitolerans]MBL7869627.1 DUF1801 domain-containing protein [Flavobacterium lindanitolerans]